ncbi:MAG TPA: M23 family metallopeptidase [Gemmatimonadaceae bacterium]|jgi:murein DD-endopeptidase MepM/ murein hydrolase activator NlpD
MRWRLLTAFPWLLSLGCKVVIEHASDSARDTTPTDTTIVLSATRPAPESVSVTPRTTLSPGEIADSVALPPSSSDLATLSAELIIPVPGVQPSELRDTFNERRGGGSRKHEALDILAPGRTPVVSASDGRILKLHNSVDGGLMVYAADASDRFVLMYAHLDHYADGMRDGLPLRQGEVIGYVGTTGDAPANTPHLHFAIAHPKDVKLWWTGEAIDPWPLLQRSIAPR